MPNPFSYALRGGVSNTRPTQSDADSTLQTLYALASPPRPLDTLVSAYHGSDKRTRNALKVTLPYFVGGTLNGKRHDDSVTSRTLLTLDIEQGSCAATPPPPEGVTEALEVMGAAGWVYTSISHTPEAPRYRVVLPLGQPLTGTLVQMQGALEASTRRAATKLALTPWCQPESWVLSQPMFLPAKLVGAHFYQVLVDGKAWAGSNVPIEPPTAAHTPLKSRLPTDPPADIPDAPGDPTLAALKRSGLYLSTKRPGMHFFKCPHVHLHDSENDTQTVYFEPHFDGNPRPSVRCFDTAPDADAGGPHLTHSGLVRELRKLGAMPRDDAPGVLDDYAAFDRDSDTGLMLDAPAVPQEWAIEQFAPIGRVTVLGGPGGQGKSLAMLHALVHLACGQPFGLFKTGDGQALRSLYVSYEDGTGQLQSRVKAITSRLATQDGGVLELIDGVTQQVRDNLRTYAADDDAPQWLMLTKPDAFSTPQATPRVAWLTEYLRSRCIRLLVLDPVVFTHQLNENDIADMATYMQVLSGVAKAADCAVVLIHHMSKAGGFGALDDINQNSLRGASSIADNSRSVMAGVNMPALDCPKFGVDPDHRSSFFVLKHTKHNYSAPLPLQVFFMHGGLMTYRADVQRVTPAVLREAKEADKVAAQQAARQARSIDLLRVMASYPEGEALSTTQIRHESGLNPRQVIGVFEHLEAEGYVAVDDAGLGRRKAVALTLQGRKYLQALDRRR
jgi:RecA-family ATPase